jgi:transcriptional regulator with XRE-family HTH domain
MRLNTTLAQKIDALFKTFHREDGGEFSYHDVEVGTNKGITAPYVWKLRTGEAENPLFRMLKALGAFFGVPVAYFFDEHAAEEDAQNLRLVQELREADMAQIALLASDLRPDSRRLILDPIEYLHTMGEPGERQPA